MRRKWWVWSLAILVLAGASLLLSGGPKRWTELSFRLWRGRYAAAAEAAVTGEPWENVPGVWSLNVWPKAGAEEVLVADFALGSWGMGSSTSYWGVCMTTDGQPPGWQGTEVAGEGGTPRWGSWREAEGDNAYQIWELDDGWYGYLMEF